MFTVDEPTAKAIRRAAEDGGELAGVVELRRHFPLISDNEQARRCVRAIVGWGAPRPSLRGNGGRARYCVIPEIRLPFRRVGV